MAHLDRFNQLRANAQQYYLEEFPRLNLTIPEAGAIGAISALNTIAITTDGSLDEEINRRAGTIRNSPIWKSAEAKVVASVK